ncbi:MAG: endonuclease/exonuclease/phosphatase family protein [Actinomycetota bacterium]
MEDWALVTPDRIDRRVLAAVCLALALVPWAWFAVRDLAPVMDVAAVLLPLVALGTACALAVASRWLHSGWATVAAGSVALFTIVVIVGPRMPLGSDPPLDPVRIAVANTYERNRDEASADSLVEEHADVLAVIEGAPAIVDGIGDAYAHVVDEGFLSVRTDLPMRELSAGAALNGARVLRVRIWGAAGPFVLYVVHSVNPLYNAAFDAQLGFLVDLLGRVEREVQPVVLAGDFNMSDRGQAYRTVASALHDATRTGWARSTYASGPWQVLFLRIDYVFTTPGWCSADAGVFSVPGSDHEGVVTSIGPCPEASTG